MLQYLSVVANQARELVYDTFLTEEKEPEEEEEEYLPQVPEIPDEETESQERMPE